LVLAIIPPQDDLWMRLFAHTFASLKGDKKGSSRFIQYKTEQAVMASAPYRLAASAANNGRICPNTDYERLFGASVYQSSGRR